MKLAKEIIISASSQKVWKAFSQLEKWPKYCDCIKKAYWTSPKKWFLNSTFMQIIRIGPIKRISYPRIINIKRGNYVTWTGTGSLVQGVHTLIFEKISNNKTKAVNTEYFKGILAPIIFPLIKNELDDYFGQFLEGLKKESEK